MATPPIKFRWRLAGCAPWKSPWRFQAFWRNPASEAPRRYPTKKAKPWNPCRAAVAALRARCERRRRSPPPFEQKVTDALVLSFRREASRDRRHFSRLNHPRRICRLRIFAACVARPRPWPIPRFADPCRREGEGRIRQSANQEQLLFPTQPPLVRARPTRRRKPSFLRMPLGLLARKSCVWGTLTPRFGRLQNQWPKPASDGLALRRPTL